MNFWFVIGTAAELIKMYPLMVEAEKRQLSWSILSTGQSAINFWQQIEDFRIPRSKVVELLQSKRDLANSSAALKWFARALGLNLFGLKGKIEKESHFSPGQTDYLFVHGDTLSTLVGAIYGKRLGCRIVHVEAGMRSHNIWSPFPEEICRRIVSKLAHLHMVPDDVALTNLRAEGITKGVVSTSGNTVVDTLRLASEIPTATAEPYVLANIHRFENLHSKKRWQLIVDLLVRIAKDHRVIMVLMPNTKEQLSLDLKNREKLIAAGVELKERLPFLKFSQLLKNASFVVTDGGSNQEECHYLGKPCLVLRDVTERREGIGGACVISGFKPEVIDEFLKNFQSYARPSAFPATRPTDIIFESVIT